MNKLFRLLALIVLVAAATSPAAAWPSVCMKCNQGCANTWSYCLAANFQSDLDCDIDREICFISCDFVCSPYYV